MRARLLDLGTVAPVRAESIYRAIAGGLAADGDPAVVLVQPSAPYVSIGVQLDGAAAAETTAETDVGGAGDLPVLPRATGGGAWLHGPGQLAFQVLIPAARAARLEVLRCEPDMPAAALASAPVAACGALGVAAVADLDGAGVRVDGETVCVTGVTVIGDTLCFVGSLVLDADPAVVARAGARPIVSLWQVLGKPPELAAAAEALISAFESCYGLTMVPSMPTPDELDAILEQDALLAAGTAPAGQPLVVH